MGVKLIAVDMDGTFLDDNKEYNRERFMKQYQQMKAQGVHFVVASGNQYYQLASFFSEIVDEIAFVAENGAFIADKGEVLFVGEADESVITHILNVLDDFPNGKTVLCGKNSAYTLDSPDSEFFQYANHYYHRLQTVEDLHQVEDQFFKFALSFPESEVEDVMSALAVTTEGEMLPVSSGHGDIDLILPGLHKANGIKMLQERWGVSDEETAAFGDSGNDYEMLAHVYYSFAMGNANDKIKHVAKYETDDNNHEGVLNAIDGLLMGEYK